MATALAMTAAIGTAAAATKPPKALEGVWGSRGYGMVLEVGRRGAQVYDVTAISCLKQPAELGFADPLMQRAVLGADGKGFTTRAPYGLTTLYFDKLAALPTPCAAPAGDPADPRYNFEVFWTTVNSHYAFFAQRGVDWKGLGDTYRAKVTAKTTDAELFEIFTRMIRQLQDRHIRIFAGDKMANAEFPPVLSRWLAEYAKNPNVPMSRFQGDKIAEHLGPAWKRYLDAGSVKRVSDLVTSGTAANGQIGYILVSGESGYVDSEDVDADVAAALAQWDGVFTAQRGRRGLILDMRINSGGNDAAALGLVGLVTAADRPGFTKCARDGAGYTPTQTTRVLARAAAFTGPVVILVSPLDWSAGENFAMIARDLPNVVLVGEPTASVHSDTLEKFLPNGWRFSVSNEAIVAPDGRLYESVGVPPDIRVPFDVEEIKAQGVDPQMEKALHLLTSGQFEALHRGVERAPSAIGRPSPCG